MSPQTELANAVLAAAKRYEDSFDHKAAVEAVAAGRFVDFRLYYGTTLLEACEGPWQLAAHLLLRADWNGAIDWAKGALRSTFGDLPVGAKFLMRGWAQVFVKTSAVSAAADWQGSGGGPLAVRVKLETQVDHVPDEPIELPEQGDPGPQSKEIGLPGPR